MQECGGVGGGWWQAQLLGKATGHWCGDTVQPPTTATQPAPAPAPAPAASTSAPRHSRSHCTHCRRSGGHCRSLEVRGVEAERSAGEAGRCSAAH